MVEIFSDGACSGNPGPGGYGTILRYGTTEKELSGYDPETTNNRMELLGAIVGLEALTRPCKVRLTTDSEYVKKGMTEWLESWIKRGWKTALRAASQESTSRGASAPLPPFSLRPRAVRSPSRAGRRGSTHVVSAKRWWRRHLGVDRGSPRAWLVPRRRCADRSCPWEWIMPVTM